MTLPMRLRDTFAQRVLAYVAFCRLLSRTKKRSFLSSSPPFEPTILNSPLFPSKLINFFDCTPRPYTYFLLSKFYSSRIEMNSLEKKKRQEEFLPFLLRYVDFRGANLSKDSRICIYRVGKTALEAFHRSSYYLRAGLYLAIRGEDFTSVVALSNVVAPSKTVRANDELLVTRSMLLVRGMPPATSVTKRIGSK